MSKPMDLPVTPGISKANAPPDYISGARRVEDEGKVQFRSDSIPVRFPVVVTDGNGKPVPNLGKDGFQVFEDGEPQTITTFQEVVSSTDVLPPAFQPAGPFTNLPPVALQPRNVTIILIDQVNAPSLDDAEARKRVLAYLAKSPFEHPSSLILLTSKGISTICGMSVDPKQVDQLLRGLGSAAAADWQSQGTGTSSTCDSSLLQQFVASGDSAASQLRPDRALELSTQAFLETGWMLSGVPGKKSLVWITEGFLFALKTPTALPGGAQSIVYERALTALHDSNTSVYPIDARLLAGASPASSTAQSKRHWLENSTPEMLKTFAAMTGGRAYLEQKEIAAALKYASGDASSYYVLGYELNTRDRKPGWRQLNVKVGNPDYQVLARSGFLVSNAVFDPEVSRTSDLDIAAASPVNSTGMPLTAAFQNISGKGGKRKADFTLVVRGDNVTFGERGKNHFQLDVWTIAERGDKQVAKLAQVVQGSLPPDQLEMVKAHGVGYKNSLELPPGDYTVRFVVRDKLSGKVGSVSAPLTIK